MGGVNWYTTLKPVSNSYCTCVFTAIALSMEPSSSWLIRKFTSESLQLFLGWTLWGRNWSNALVWGAILGDGFSERPLLSCWWLVKMRKVMKSLNIVVEHWIWLVFDSKMYCFKYLSYFRVQCEILPMAKKCKQRLHCGFQGFYRGKLNCDRKEVDDLGRDRWIMKW